MNINRKMIAATAAALALAVSLAGCWDDNDDQSPAAPPAPPPVVLNEVPDSAGANSASFFSYLLALSGNDESSEPLILRDSLVLPADETTEPIPLI